MALAGSLVAAALLLSVCCAARCGVGFPFGAWRRARSQSSTRGLDLTSLGRLASRPLVIKPPRRPSRDLLLSEPWFDIATGAAVASVRTATSSASRNSGDDPAARMAARTTALLEWNHRPSTHLDWDRAYEIGSGGAGRVYRLTCRGLGTVAAKRFQTITPEDREEKLRQLEREARMLAAVHHPNIVPLFGISTDNPDRCCLILQYSPLGSLRYALDGGSLAPKSLEAWMGGIVRGMAHLHSREPPLLHHDLKPSNVLVFDAWTAKLTDFGIATSTGLSTMGTAHRTIAPTAGTYQYLAAELEPSHLPWPSTHLPWSSIRYLAPELFGTAPKFTAACDMYAFGVVLWEMCTRQRPWAGESLATAGMAILSGRRPDSLPGCELTDSPLAELARRAWAQAPEARPTFEALFADLPEAEASLVNATTAAVQKADSATTTATAAVQKADSAATTATAAVQKADSAATTAAAMAERLASIEAAVVEAAASATASAAIMQDGVASLQRPPPIDEWMRRGLVQVGAAVADGTSFVAAVWSGQWDAGGDPLMSLKAFDTCSWTLVSTPPGQPNLRMIPVGSGFLIDERGLIFTDEHVRSQCQWYIDRARDAGSPGGRIVVAPYAGQGAAVDLQTSWTCETLAYTHDWNPANRPPFRVPEAPDPHVAPMSGVALSLSERYADAAVLFATSHVASTAPFASAAHGAMALHLGGVQVGESLWCLGLPYSGGATPTPSVGQHLGYDKDEHGEWLKFDGLIMPGASGGPVVNQEGRVVAWNVRNRGDAPETTRGLAHLRGIAAGLACIQAARAEWATRRIQSRRVHAALEAWARQRRANEHVRS